MSGSAAFSTPADSFDPAKVTPEQLERAILRKRARRELRSFGRYVFDLEPAPHHDLWLEALQAVAAGEIKRLLLIGPPGHAKSTYMSVIFPTWMIGRDPNASYIGVTTTDTLARLYGDAVRTTIEESPDFKAVFPRAQPDYGRGWAREGFFVRDTETPRRRSDKDPSGVYVGAGGAIIGRRADGLIIDDAVDEEVARSELLLEQRKLWITRSAISRLKPEGFIVVAGTLWTDGDVVSTFKDDPTFVVIEMRALSSTQKQTADVWIPDTVAWRPAGVSREVRDG